MAKEREGVRELLNPALAILKLREEPWKHEKAIINNYLLYALTVNHNPYHKRRHFILEVKHERSEVPVKDTKTKLEEMRAIKNYHRNLYRCTVHFVESFN